LDAPRRSGPVAIASTISEPKELAESDLNERMRKLEKRPGMAAAARQSPSK
jgi:hypothetical protein